MKDDHFSLWALYVDLKDRALSAARCGDLASMRKWWTEAGRAYGDYRHVVDGKTGERDPGQALSDRQLSALDRLVARLTQDPNSDAAPETSRFVRTFA